MALDQFWATFDKFWDGDWSVCGVAVEKFSGCPLISFGKAFDQLRGAP